MSTVTPPIESTRTVDFREEVGFGTGIEVKKPCPINGFVSAVVMHWPPGCTALVDVGVIHLQGGVGGRQTGIVPTDSGIYLALDDATPIFNLYFPVKKGDYFMVVILNRDDTYDHIISVDIILNPKVLMQPIVQPVPTPTLPEPPVSEPSFPPEIPEEFPELPQFPEFPEDEET